MPSETEQRKGGNDMKDEKCACQGGSLVRFVQPILLTLLNASPDHGYELVRKIGETRLWQDSRPDAAGVYRVLRDMESRGLIVSHLETDSKAGMGKRVFSITDAGRACAMNWLSTLLEYRAGIDDVIGRLEVTVDEITRMDSNPADNTK